VDEDEVEEAGGRECADDDDDAAEGECNASTSEDADGEEGAVAAAAIAAEVDAWESNGSRMSSERSSKL
jgi:hypothetical protein